MAIASARSPAPALDSGSANKNVQRDRPGTGFAQTIQQRRVNGPPPGPLAQLGDACIVDGNDDDILRRGACGQRLRRREQHPGARKRPPDTPVPSRKAGLPGMQREAVAPGSAASFPVSRERPDHHCNGQQDLQPQRQWHLELTSPRRTASCCRLPRRSESARNRCRGSVEESRARDPRAFDRSPCGGTQDLAQSVRGSARRPRAATSRASRVTRTLAHLASVQV